MESWLGKMCNFEVTALWGQPVDKMKLNLEERSDWDADKSSFLETV